MGRQPGVRRRTRSTGCATRSPSYLGATRRRSTSSTRSPAPIPRTASRVRVVTTHPYHALFAKTMFIDPTAGGAAGFAPQALVLHAPALEADPDEDGTRTGTFIVLHPSRTEVLIGGTFYAGEIKKSIFTVMNDRLPLEGVLPMHCSANVGDDGTRCDLLRALRHGQDDALGRSRARADRRRRARLGRRRRLQLRGRLLREGDPPLGRGRAGDLPDDAHVRDDPRERRRSTSTASSTSTTTRRPRTRAPRTSSSRSRTRTRTSAPAIRRRSCMLTADAFGILPPIARLDRRSRRSTTSSPASRRSSPAPRSASTEPQPTFSTCFGAPFLPQPPRGVRGDARRASSTSTAPTVWLVNTGWTGGPFGEGRADADRRDARAAARRARRASSTASSTARPGLRLRGAGGGARASTSALLDPRSTWRDPEAYDRKAHELAGMFRENFEQVRRRSARPRRGRAAGLTQSRGA